MRTDEREKKVWDGIVREKGFFLSDGGGKEGGEEEKNCGKSAKSRLRH